MLIGVPCGARPAVQKKLDVAHDFAGHKHLEDEHVVEVNMQVALESAAREQSEAVYEPARHDQIEVELEPEAQEKQAEVPDESPPHGRTQVAQDRMVHGRVVLSLEDLGTSLPVGSLIGL
jgi:hypothetical protein